jgi:hypothetical protein
LGQEFVIKSQNLEDRINQLLPSQGGAQAGVDLSASSMIVPIIDLTESAEGSNLRQDLQRSLSLTGITSFAINNTTTTLINTTGYYRIYGYLSTVGGALKTASFDMTDGTTTKRVHQFALLANTTSPTNIVEMFDFMVLLQAGDSISGTSDNTLLNLVGTTRQIADINGNLVNP